MLRFSRATTFLAALLTMSFYVPAYAEILLVGNKGENTISFIDLATGAELAREQTGKAPHEIAISPDGRLAAAVAYGAASIDIFDVSSRKRLRTIDLSPNVGPHGLAWLTDGRIIATTERSNTLTIVDTARGDKVTSVETGQLGSHMVAVSPDGKRAYTANITAGTATVIDLQRMEKIRDIVTGGKPEGIALSKDGGELWVGDLEGARVSVFDTQSFAKIAEVKTGDAPIRVATSPNGRFVVTSNVGSGTLTVIDTENRQATREIPVSGSGDAAQVTIIFSADGKRIYTAETHHNSIAEIDFDSGKVIRRIKAGEKGDGLVIAP